jgi:hypothetical protein
MSEQHYAPLVEHEINQCVKLLERTWNLGVFSDPLSNPIALRSVIADIFYFCMSRANQVINSNILQAPIFEKLDDRNEFLNDEEGSHLQVFDGLCRALRDNVDNMHNLSWIMTCKLKPYHQFYEAIQREVLDRINGLENCTPKGFDQYQDAYKRDDTAAIINEEQRMREEMANYKGYFGDQRDYPLPKRNALHNIFDDLQMVDRLSEVFVNNLCAQAILLMQHINTQDALAEIEAIDARVPFINQYALIPGAWAEFGRAHRADTPIPVPEFTPELKKLFAHSESR